ncbi:MAG TPA: hypothetical protein VKI44_06020 [Acetobacteraceae bacterium]|nr:hypothetical protein [Acetobacteraceae bacterium]
MIKLTYAATALALGLLGAAAPALAQSTTPSPARSALGDWLYDSNGGLIGSVYSLTDNGRTAVLQLGSYRTPGRRLVAVPATDITIVGGHAVLTGASAAAAERLPAIG